MLKLLPGIILVAVSLLPATIRAEDKNPAMIWNEGKEQKDARMKWWNDARFGLFLHWGLYAMPAKKPSVKAHEKMTSEQYQKYFNHFDPDLYQPREWAKMAKEAGMKYVVITSKHHEGFCLFDSKFTDYKATNTPAGRDLLREFLAAFRAEGLKVGFYYSLLDWHHPDYTIDRLHPQSPASGTDEDYTRMNEHRDMAKYREYVSNQVRELLTNYGEISILWLDYSFKGPHGKGRDDWDSMGLLRLARSLQPGIIVNDRADLKDVPGGGDFASPEQVAIEALGKYRKGGLPWETCQTLTGTWCYRRENNQWKPSAQLLELLITSVANGGNLLLNVGPTARGEFEAGAKERLGAIAEWMHSNRRSIYGCTAAPDEFIAPAQTLMTYNPVTKRLYLHLLGNQAAEVLLTKMGGRVNYMQFLHDGSEINFEDKAGDLTVKVPENRPSVAIPVIEIFLDK